MESRENCKEQPRGADSDCGDRDDRATNIYSQQKQTTSQACLRSAPPAIKQPSGGNKNDEESEKHRNSCNGLRIIFECGLTHSRNWLRLLRERRELRQGLDELIHV